jgi:hypothetical protein
VARDFYPEESPGLPLLVHPGRDFIPEGGLTAEEARLGIKDTRRDDHPNRQPPGIAPLLAKDFIHEALVEPPPKEAREAETIPRAGQIDGPRGDRSKGLPPPGHGVDSASGIVHELGREKPAEGPGSEPLHPDDPRLKGGASEEENSGAGDDDAIPEGYEMTGTDEDGHPILRRKRTGLPSRTTPEASGREDAGRQTPVEPARNKGGRPRKTAIEETGAKGGEVNEIRDRAIGNEPDVAETLPAPSALPKPALQGNVFDGIFDKRKKP